MMKSGTLKNNLLEMKNKIVDLKTNKTFLSCALLTVLYLISGYWKWLEIGMSLTALTFMAILPLQGSLCIFMFLHNFTLSNIGYDSCYLVTIIGYTIILIVKYWLGVKNGTYTYHKKIVNLIICFYTISTALSLFQNIYRGSWMYYVYLPIIFLLVAMRKDLNIFQGMNYMFGGLAVSCALAMFSLILPGFQYVVFLNKRFSGFINNPNYLYMRAIFVLAYYMFRYLSKNLSLLKFCAIYSICAGITLATLSKAGIGVLALFTILFVILFLKDDFKQRIKIVGIFVLVGLVIALLGYKLIIELFERFATDFKAGNFLNSLLTGRDDIWNAYYNAITASPFKFLFGHGLLAQEVYIPAQLETRASHNFYLFLLYRFGMVGTIMLGYIIYQIIKLALNDKPRFIAYLPLIFIAVESLFDNTFKPYNITYFAFAIMILIMSVSQNKTEENQKIKQKSTKS